ncbi:MAG: efflux RND transporter periplasmic adaptor subunit [Rhizomicrobium sp.]
MNIWVANTFQTLSGRAQRVPQAFERLDKRTRLIVIAVAAVAVLSLLLYLLFGGTAKRKVLPPPPVIVATATSRNVTVVEHTIGTVVANSTVQVTARVSGQLMSAGFREGQMVHTGDLLFQLDPKPFIAALEQARAQLAKDEAQLVSALNDQKRYDTLFAQNAASQQQRDQADATARGFIATVQSDHAAVDIARLNLGYAQIHSPIDGKTGPILVQPGNLVTADATTPLLTITQIQPVKISFFLPQDDLTQIQNQMKAGRLLAVIPMQGAPGGNETAKVDFVGNQVDAQTGTIELRATYDNADLRLVPGQMVDVGTTLKDIPKATVVPRNAVNAGPDNSYVYVVDAQSKAEMKIVTVLNDDGTNDAIQGGVKAGDKVITDGQSRVVPGATVKIAGKGRGAQQPSGGAQ